MHSSQHSLVFTEESLLLYSTPQLMLTCTVLLYPFFFFFFLKTDVAASTYKTQDWWAVIVYKPEGFSTIESKERVCSKLPKLTNEKAH